MRPLHVVAAIAAALLVVLLLSPRMREPLVPDGATRELQEGAAQEQRIEIIEIEMLSEPESKSAPAVAPPSSPPPPPEPPAVPVARVAQSEAHPRGESLLESGTFPRLRATYKRIGFSAYRDAVLELGGGFFLFDASARTPVAEVDPRSGAVQSERVRANLSRWPRDVTRHLGETLRLGQERYGPRVSRVILLPPVHLDAALLGALDAHLRAQDIETRALVRVDVAYELRGGRLHCDVLTLALRDGTERPVSLEIDLSGGAS